MPESTILIVEDEGVVAFDLETRLNHLGYKVVGTADTGHRAFETANEDTRLRATLAQSTTQLAARYEYPGSVLTNITSVLE